MSVLLLLHHLLLHRYLQLFRLPELQQEFPELAEFSAVPKSVLEAAVKGKNLTDAYLRYQRTESKRVSAAKATQEQAAKVSAGSQAEGAGETTNPTIDAMMAGVWG